MSPRERIAVACLALGAAAYGLPVSGQYVVNDLATLRSLSATVNDASITLAPGDYWIDGDHISNPTGSRPIFLELGGSNNTYNLKGANLKLDTRKLDGFGRALGHDSGVRVVKISGSGNTINDLSLTGYDLELDTNPIAQRHADWAAVYVQLSGDNNSVQGADVLSRGSSPYGLGDVFGKGGRRFPQGEPPGQVPGEPEGVVGLPWIHHNKTSSFLVYEATGATVDDMHLQVKTYGHGFFVQKSSDTTLTNSTVVGELVSSNDIIAHPKYQEYGFTSHGNELPPDIMISKAEDGVRLYGSIDGVGTVGLTVDNVVVTNMRSGFATSLGFTDLDNGLGINLSNVESYGAEVGFSPGSLTNITNAKADIANGPAVHIPYNNARDTTIDLELVGETPVGLDWAAAYLNGQRFDVTIDSDLAAGSLPEDSLVRLGQTFFNSWRDRLQPNGPEDADPGDFIDSVFVNNTNQMMVLGNLTTNNTGSSQTPVVTNGKDNAYDGVSLVPSGHHTVLVHEGGLGNSGTAAAGTLETNGSIVESGGTLELSPGIWITDEKLTISGDGLDGRGALYSDGQTGSGTRFGSSGSGDESTIYLDGNASIGVGVAGNQLLVGRIQGTGNLTKRGPGNLSMEKSNTFVGNLTVAEGNVTARSGGVNHGLTVFADASISSIGHGGVYTTDTVLLYGLMDVNARNDANPLSATVGPLFGSGVVGASNEAATQASTLTIDTPAALGFFVGQIRDHLNLVKAGEGAQALSGTNTYTGTTTVSEGLLQVHGTHVGGGDYTVESGGMLGGNGDIDAAVVIESGGVLAPGASAGELTVQSVQLQAGSTLAIELEGSVAYDLLSADDLILGGELAVSLIGSGFMPGAGDVFTVVSTDSLTGVFGNVADGERLDTLGGEGSFLVSYSESLDTVTLSAFTAAGLPGDFNADGSVDAADYTVWRDGLGTTHSQTDYDSWKNNYRANAPATSQSVPEPAGFLILLVAFTLRCALGVRTAAADPPSLAAVTFAC